MIQVSFLFLRIPEPFTFQTLGGFATGVCLRRNDALASDLLCVGMGAEPI